MTTASPKTPWPFSLFLLTTVAVVTSPPVYERPPPNHHSGGHLTSENPDYVWAFSWTCLRLMCKCLYYPCFISPAVARQSCQFKGQTTHFEYFTVIKVPKRSCVEIRNGSPPLLCCLDLEDWLWSITPMSNYGVIASHWSCVLPQFNRHWWSWIQCHLCSPLRLLPRRSNGTQVRP